MRRIRKTNRKCGSKKRDKTLVDSGPMEEIMNRIQCSEACHKKCIMEMKRLYEKLKHDDFHNLFIIMIKTAMSADEKNEYAHRTLLFCAKFIASYEGAETHPVFADTFRWLLGTISNEAHIRFRLCQLVNMILMALGEEATLDDAICDDVIKYMLGRLVDVAPKVRVQAILAMQRLQEPDNHDDPVQKAYQYHLCSDPSSSVRQAIIKGIAKNSHTLPYILKCLWDIDEKVRRHTYIILSSYPVRLYKVSQRLTLLEQGLNDRSASVRRVVTNVMLQQWIASYQKDLIALINALKEDGNEMEILRFRKIAKQALGEIFMQQEKTDIIACLPLTIQDNCYRCIPFGKLNIETAFYWQCLTEFLQQQMADELDLIIPELTVFCSYVESYCVASKRVMDKFKSMEFQYVLLSLMEIIYTFDLGDEFGRRNLHKLLEDMLTNYSLDEKVIAVTVKCVENLITNQNTRDKFLLNIIRQICGLNAKQADLVSDQSFISELIANEDEALKLKPSSLKVKILELEEQEMNYIQRKDYVAVQQITESKNSASKEFTNLLSPLLDKRNSRVLTNECILRSLQITFHMIVSKNVKTIGQATCGFYNDFILHHINSSQVAIRDWALKCATACSMLYEPFAKDVFGELYAQFFRNQNIRIWETSITCIFELIDRYGIDRFVEQKELNNAENKHNKTGGKMNNTLEFEDIKDDSDQSEIPHVCGVIFLMFNILDTCNDLCIIKAIINGICRLVLHGHLDNQDIIEKLLLQYFNPNTDPEINQLLGAFLEQLIQDRKQHILLPSLMSTINSVLTASDDSPLSEIGPETITHFIIDFTEPGILTEDSHNVVALTFLNEMINKSDNKKLCKLLAKELLTLDVNISPNSELKGEMKKLVDKILELNRQELDRITVKNLTDFKKLLDRVKKPTQTRTEEDEITDEEMSEFDFEFNKDDDEAGAVGGIM